MKGQVARFCIFYQSEQGKDYFRKYLNYLNVLLKSSKYINHHCVLSKKCPYDKPEWQEHCDLDEKPPGLLPAYQEALPLATALLSFTVTVGHSCL